MRDQGSSSLSHSPRGTVIGAALPLSPEQTEIRLLKNMVSDLVKQNSESEKEILNSLKSLFVDVTYDAADEAFERIIAGLDSIAKKIYKEGFWTKTVYEPTIIPAVKALHGTIAKRQMVFNAQVEEIKAAEKQQSIPVAEVDARIDAAIKATAEKAYKTGATDIIQSLVDILKRNPEAVQALEHAEGGAQVLALVGYEGHEKAQQNGRTSPQSTQAPVKTETQEMQKCREWIGIEKFKVIQPLVELFEKKETSKTEKQLIQFLIFQLMLHSKDKTVKAILEEVGSFFVKEAKLNPEKHPALMSLLSKHAEREDEINATPLTKEEYQVFAQLISPKSALFIPKDEQALKVFGSHFATMNGKDVPLVTEKEYKEHFLKSLSQEVQKAPAAPAAGVHFWPGNHPVQSVGAAAVSGVLSQQEGPRK